MDAHADKMHILASGCWAARNIAGGGERAVAALIAAATLKRLVTAFRCVTRRAARRRALPARPASSPPPSQHDAGGADLRDAPPSPSARTTPLQTPSH